jgi:hypothetical protein
LVAVQSIETGDASASLSPPVAPHYQLKLGTEEPVVYNNQATYYHILSICAAVQDAKTQTPWALPNNPALTTELHNAITLYVANNPPSGNNHWKIATDIYKIQ